MALQIKPTVKLNEANWSAFRHDLIGQLAGHSRILSAAEGQEAESNYEIQLKSLNQQREALVIDQGSYSRDYKRREDDFNKCVDTYQITAAELHRAETIPPAQLTRMLDALPLSFRTRWHAVQNDLMDIADDFNARSSAITLQILYEERMLIDGIAAKLDKVNADLRKLDNKLTEITKLIHSETAQLIKESSYVINLIMLEGANGYIEPTYFKSLQTDSKVWPRLRGYQTDNKLRELLDFLKSLQRNENGNREFAPLLEIFSIVPKPGELLPDFDRRFDLLYQEYSSSCSRISNIVNSSFSEFNENSRNLRVRSVGGVVLEFNERLITDKYRQIIKDHYATPSVRAFLEPYYRRNVDSEFKPVPAVLSEFRRALRSSVNTYAELGNKDDSYFKFAAKFQGSAQVSSLTTTAPRASMTKCEICGKANHATIKCFKINEILRAELKKVAEDAASKKGSSDKSNIVNNNSNKLTNKKKPIIDKNFKNNKVKFNANNANKGKSVVASAHFHDGSDDDDDVEIFSIIASVESNDQSVQLDNGANRHIFNEERLFFDEPTENRSVNLYTVFSNSPTSVTRGGMTAFGEALYHSSSRNILSQSILEDEGFSIEPIRQTIGGNRITAAWRVRKGTIDLLFQRTNGIFLAPIQSLLNVSRPSAISATMTTRSMAQIAANDEPYDANINNTVDDQIYINPGDNDLNIVDNTLNIADNIDNSVKVIEDYVESNDNDAMEIDVGKSNDNIDKIDINNMSEIHPNIDIDSNVNVGGIENDNPTYLDFGSRQFSLPPTANGDPRYVPSLGRAITKLEESKLSKIHKIHAATGHAGKLTERALVDGGHVLNTDLTARDVDLYYEMFPTCLACVKGKSRLPPQVAYKIPTGALIGQYWELDIGFFGCRAFLLMVEVLSGFVTTYFLPSRKEASVVKAVDSWNALLRKNFHAASQAGIHLRCDREKVFKVFEAHAAVQIERTSAEGHACRAEVLIRIIKERARAIIDSLPYTLPPARYSDLIDYIATMKNFLPKTIQDSLTTPYEAVAGLKIKEKDLLQLQFGKIGCCLIPLDQRTSKDKAVAQEGILVGFEPHNPINLKIYLPSTGGTVYRQKFIHVYEGANVISKLNEQASHCSREEFLGEEESNYNNINNTTNSSKGYIMSMFDSNNIDINNMTLQQARFMYGEDATFDACMTEINNMIRMNVFEVIDPRLLKSTTILPSKDFAKAKFVDGRFQKLKVRIVLRGDLQAEGTYAETSSPTADKASLFTLLALNKHIKGDIYSVDIPAAFLFADVQEEIYMRLSSAMSKMFHKAKPDLPLDQDHRVVVRLLKALYGLKQAPNCWYNHLVKVIKQAGFGGCSTDACVFQRTTSSGITMLLIFVDDLIVSTNSATHIRELKVALRARFGELEWNHRCFTYLGIHLEQQGDHSIAADMIAYTLGIVAKFEGCGFGLAKGRRASNPSTMSLFKDINNNNNVVHNINNIRYISILMELMYLSTIRIDILKECILLASKSQSPSQLDWEALARVVEYLRQKPHYLIRFGLDAHEPVVLNVYVDASYAEHVDSRSHTGIFITLGKNSGPLLVKSKKQKMVTSSSTEAELLALTEATKLSMFLSRLLAELGYGGPTLIHQDNTSCIRIAEVGEGLGGSKAKHFRVRYHYLREMMLEGVIQLQYLETANMVADFLTKPMIGKEFQRQVLRAMVQGDAEFMETVGGGALARVKSKMSTA